MNCLICGKVSETKVCYEANCILLSDCSYQTGDTVIYDFIEKKKCVKEILFILTTIKKGLDKYDISELFIKQTEDNEDLSYPQIELFSGVNRKSFQLDTIVRLISEHNTVELEFNSNSYKGIDEKIISSVDKQVYGLLKFVIKRANMSLTFDDYTSKTVRIPGVYKLENESLYQEEEFKNSTYLYHGSNFHNWFSIIYNGLQIFSGTKKMTNGNSYGNGIYLSNDINMSAGYSGERFLPSSYKMSRPDFVMGVFEVNNASKYSKTPNIFVVNNKKDIRLKYIINMCNIPPEDIKSFSLYLTNSKKSVETNVKKYISTMKNKRLLMEYSRIQKKQTEVDCIALDYEVLETEDLTTWTVKLLNIDSDSKLFTDMQAMEVDAIYLSVKFTERYPIVPPTIRVIKPGFVPLTGHVTAGGAICFELLTNQGWSPAINMDNLFINIKAIISEDGRIQKKVDPTYTEANSKAGRERFMKAHNWS